MAYIASMKDAQLTDQWLWHRDGRHPLARAPQKMKLLHLQKRTSPLRLERAKRDYPWRSLTQGPMNTIQTINSVVVRDEDGCIRAELGARPWTDVAAAVLKFYGVSG